MQSNEDSNGIQERTVDTGRSLVLFSLGGHNCATSALEEYGGVKGHYR